MPTKYNLTFLDNSVNIVDTFNGVNAASNSLMAIMFLIVIWMVFVLILFKNGIVQSMFFASFIVTVVSVIFLGLGWVTTPIMAICLAMTLITGFMSYMANR